MMPVIIIDNIISLGVYYYFYDWSKIIDGFYLPNNKLHDAALKYPMAHNNCLFYQTTKFCQHT